AGNGLRRAPFHRSPGATSGKQLALIASNRYADAGRKSFSDLGVVDRGQVDLLEPVGGLHPSDAIPRGLYSRERRRQQDADDGNDDQQFDERNPTAQTSGHVSFLAFKSHIARSPSVPATLYRKNLPAS